MLELPSLWHMGAVLIVDSSCPSFGEAFPAASALPSCTRCLPWDGGTAPLPISDTQGLSQLCKGKLLFIEDAGMLKGWIQGRMAHGTLLPARVWLAFQC